MYHYYYYCIFHDLEIRNQINDQNLKVAYNFSLILL